MYVPEQTNLLGEIPIAYIKTHLNIPGILCEANISNIYSEALFDLIPLTKKCANFFLEHGFGRIQIV